MLRKNDSETTLLKKAAKEVRNEQEGIEGLWLQSVLYHRDFFRASLSNQTNNILVTIDFTL